MFVPPRLPVPPAVRRWVWSARLANLLSFVLVFLLLLERVPEAIVGLFYFPLVLLLISPEMRGLRVGVLSFISLSELLGGAALLVQSSRQGNRTIATYLSLFILGQAALLVSAIKAYLAAREADRSSKLVRILAEHGVEAYLAAREAEESSKRLKAT